MAEALLELAENTETYDGLDPGDVVIGRTGRGPTPTDAELRVRGLRVRLRPSGTIGREAAIAAEFDRIRDRHRAQA
ncbi:hypothetical protein [Actinokineospora sp. NPDC004072]